MLKPYFISQESENPLVDLSSLSDPISVNEFAEFEGIDPLANSKQLSRALGGAFDFVERHTMQSFRPVGRRAHYDIQGISTIPCILLLPGFKPELLEMRYGSGAVISIPEDLQTYTQPNGVNLVTGINDLIDPANGERMFSILYRAGMSGDDESGGAVLSSVQSLAKSYYESVYDPNLIRSVNSNIRPYKAFRIV